MAETFRTSWLEAQPSGDGRIHVLDRASGSAALFAVEDAQLLISCDSYRPLEEHAERWSRRAEKKAVEQISQKTPGWFSTLIRKAEEATPADPRKQEYAIGQLRRFADEGWLVSSVELARQCAATVRGEDAQPITTVGFTTRNRPKELERAIRSYAENFRAFERKAGITLIDDGASDAETRELAGRLARELELPIRIAGRADRERWAEELAREAGVDPATARFALLGDARCPITTGSARNALLLDSVGEAYLLADDDGVCKSARCPEAEEGWELTSRADPTQFWFYESREKLHERVRFDEVDLLALHERLLGREAGALFEADSEPGALFARAALDQRLRRKGANVRASMAGVVGDSGLGGSAYLFRDPWSQARITVSEEFFRAAVESRQVLRATTRLTIGDSTTCMAGNLGIDHTALLPPFSPVQRNSDGLFGRLLKICFERSVMGYLPEAALHDPVETRTQSIEAYFKGLRRVRFADYLIRLFEIWELRSTTQETEGSLRSLGSFLTERAEGPAEELDGLLLSRILEAEGPKLQQDRSAEVRELPGYYAALRSRCVETTREAIADPAYLTPRDLGGENPRGLAREMTAQTGRLLQVWPELRAAAARLREKDSRLARA